MNEPQRFAVYVPCTDHMEWFDTLGEAQVYAETYGDYGRRYVLEVKSTVSDAKSTVSDGE